MSKLKGKTAIITGGAGGIGQATASLFLHEGATVMLVDRDEEALARVCHHLGRFASFVAADVAEQASARRYVSATIDKFGGVDILFANAGMEGPCASVTETSVDDFDRVQAVNVRGVFLGIREAAPVMAKRGGGSIIITSSVAGLVGASRLAAYVTSKHALVGLARASAVDLAGDRIRVNTINPGPIDNRMMRSVESQLGPGQEGSIRHGFEQKVALGRYGTNEEIARLALFLASDDSSYCTGSVFVADGGYVAQ